MSKIVTEKINSDVIFENINDNTQGFKFDINNIPVGNIRTITIPNSNFTITGTDTIQTLTNKTIIDSTNNIIANGIRSLTTNVTTNTSPAPTLGQYLVATSNTTAAWQTITPGAAVFGSQYAYYESIANSSTGSTFVNKINVSTPSIPAGVYRIGWTYIYNITTNSGTFNSQFNVDTNLESFTTTITRATDLPSSYTGFKTYNFSSGIHTLILRFNASTGTAFMSNARIEIYRIS
jgi:hypothetical protein